MTARYMNILRPVSLFTLICVLHIYVVAVPNATPAPQASGTLKTTNNQPITVNGNSVTPGTTILSGASIQTPPGVAATLNLGFATIEIAPDSDVLVEFTADGNVKVTMRKGCVTVKTQGNANGSIVSPDGTTTNTGNDHKAEVCYPAKPGGGGGGGFNGTLAALLIAGGGATALIIALATRGGNPSPSTP